MSLIGGTTGGLYSTHYSLKTVCMCVYKRTCVCVCVSGHLLSLKFTLKECELLLLEGSIIIPLGIYK